MNSIFASARVFNSNILTWNVGQVTKMHEMCWGAINFKKNLCKWNNKVPADVTPWKMFYNAKCDKTDPPENWCFECEA